MQNVAELLIPLIRLVEPPPDRSSWEWANEKRILPRESAEPGPWDSMRAPWTIGISNAINAPFSKRVTMVMGSQQSKTETLLNVMGHKLCDDPQPILYVGPTKKNVESLSSDRFTKMIESVPEMQEALAKGHRNKITEKFFNGTRCGFGWAGSATELASHPVAIAIIDERDRMVDVPGEGSVDGLVKARLSTYDGLQITASTPLLGDVVKKRHEVSGLEHWEVGEADDIASPTWLIWQQGTRHEWCVPCAGCSVYFIPHLGLLVYDAELDPERIYETAGLSCPNCGELLENVTKEEMNNRGAFVAPGQVIEDANWSKEGQGAIIDHVECVYGDYLPVPNKLRHPSFWVSGLCSNWVSYGERASDIAIANNSKKVGEIQTAWNTSGGEMYKPKGQAPDWKDLLDLKQGYKKGDVPEGAMILTAGVDVQKNSLYYVVRGWGPNYDSFLIDNGQLMGATKHQYVWDLLAEVLSVPYDDHPIRLMLVDSGYNPSDEPKATNAIYKFCYENPTAMPTKGHDYQTQTHRASNIAINIHGRVIKQGLKLWHLDTDFFKSFVYTRLEWEVSQLGGWHCPADTEDEYFRQLVAEARIILANGNVKWEQLRKDNHYLDCEMNATAAAHILRLYRLKDGMKPDQPKRSRRQVHGGIHDG